MERQRFIFLASDLRRTAVGAVAVLVDEEEAEDVAQETMLRMWESVERLDDDEARLNAFAATTARNLVRNRLRQKRRHPLQRLLGIHDRQADETPQRRLEDIESQDVFAQALEQLPYNWRRVLQMRNVEDMTFIEIAAVLGTTESSVRGLLSKSRKRMVELINKQIR